MSERLDVDSQSLQQFFSDSPWEERELWSAIRREVIPNLDRLTVGRWTKRAGSNREIIRWEYRTNIAGRWASRPPAKALCLRLSLSRWHIEQYFQCAKDDLGLDHFEGSSWRGAPPPSGSERGGLFMPVVFLRAEKTSGVTWEVVLRAIRPWLVRSTGFCFCRSNNFEGICDDTT